MSSSNVAVYYGQTDQTSNVPLSIICADRDVDIIILAFVNKLSTGPVGYPALNMGPHCWATSSAQVHEGATGLIDCVGDGFAEQVKSCQNTGKKVLLSIGGAIGYSETTIASEEDAVRIADNIWNLFGGGMDNDTITAIRPFGDVIFDGFDIGKPFHIFTNPIPIPIPIPAPTV
jgi:chitinase